MTNVQYSDRIASVLNGGQDAGAIAMMDSDFRRMGCGRYGFDWEAPWGQSVPAEMMVVPARGWPERPESRDPRWAAFPVGPTVVAIRLLGEIPTRAPSPSPKPRMLAKQCH